MSGEITVDGELAAAENYSTHVFKKSRHGRVYVC